MSLLPCPNKVVICDLPTGTTLVVLLSRTKMLPSEEI